MEYFVIFIICTISGFLTGLLSIGGGIIIVPLFLSILPLFGIELSLHEVIGVSTTCVLLNSSVTAFYRRNEPKLPFRTMFPLIISIIIGTLTGAVSSDFAPKNIILGIYVIVCMLSLYLINGEIYVNLKEKNLYYFMYIIFACIGAISASIGIGGAIFFVTALKCFMGKDTKELLPTITILVLCHAFFAFAGKFTLGHVPVFVIPIAFVASLLGSRIGVNISKKLTSKVLNILLSLILVWGMIKIIFEILK